MTMVFGTNSKEPGTGDHHAYIYLTGKQERYGKDGTSSIQSSEKCIGGGHKRIVYSISTLHNQMIGSKIDPFIITTVTQIQSAHPLLPSLTVYAQASKQASNFPDDSTQYSEVTPN
mmetsp:Transcript_56840/g.138355  ORF Transcript_56840/g.138355 Transcript_56840/m.138355 type:complete len:116 (+) Transcript_56840:5072-5419(+)